MPDNSSSTQVDHENNDYTDYFYYCWNIIKPEVLKCLSNCYDLLLDEISLRLINSISE